MLGEDDRFAFVKWNKRNRDLPESELVCIDVAELVGLLDLDHVLELTDSLGRLNLGRERGRFTINETEQSYEIVSHGVAEHQLKGKGIVQNEG